MTATLEIQEIEKKVIEIIAEEACITPAEISPDTKIP